MSVYQDHVCQLIKMLQNLDRWLDEAVAYANECGFDPDLLVDARLRPDMFPLARQVQSACDTAKFAAARLTGTTAPKNPDEERTIAELKERIAFTVSYLEGFSPEDFEGSLDREFSLPMLQGARVYGRDFLSVLAAQRLLPPHDRLQHPPAQRRQARQARLPGQPAHAPARGGLRRRLPRGRGGRRLSALPLGIVCVPRRLCSSSWRPA